jgi:hypothetical protein
MCELQQAIYQTLTNRHNPIGKGYLLVSNSKEGDRREGKTIKGVKV